MVCQVSYYCIYFYKLEKGGRPFRGYRYHPVRPPYIGSWPRPYISQTRVWWGRTFIFQTFLNLWIQLMKEATVNNFILEGAVCSKMNHFTRRSALWSKDSPLFSTQAELWLFDYFAYIFQDLTRQSLKYHHFCCNFSQRLQDPASLASIDRKQPVVRR